ncbi:MAG: hypothetical protein CL666_08760 [Balneola sp.]|nr:hypothetical protein [Balneola sp.]|tara:strand:+ start:5965 stop:6474 length:510 start_codon:yes stop_codon:yes gene_type:complete
MASLSDKHKTFIIVRLACYETPTEVQTSFREEYGTEISLSQIAYYNAKGSQADKLAGKWIDLFNEARHRFNTEISDIPIASQAFRLKKLQKNLERMEQMRNYKGANETIEQAAKEVGGAFTNEKKLDHSGSIGGVLVSPQQQDPEQWAQDVVTYQQKVKELTEAEGNGG